MFDYLVLKLADLVAWLSNDYVYFVVRNHLRAIKELNCSIGEYLALTESNEGRVNRLVTELGLLVGARNALLAHLGECRKIDPLKSIASQQTVLKAWAIFSETLFNFEKKAGLTLDTWRIK